MRHRGTLEGGHPVRRDRWVAAVSVLLMLLSAGLLWSALRHPVEDRGVDEVASPPRGQPSAGTTGSPRLRVTASEPPVADTTVRWRRVLVRLDRRRAHAYATADPALLRRIYTRGSEVLHRDRALLLRYRRQGLTVRGMRMRILRLEVRTRRRDHVVLAVRERLSDATVREAGARRHLRADDVDHRVLVLRHHDGAGWRVAAVR